MLFSQQLKLLKRKFPKLLSIALVVLLILVLLASLLPAVLPATQPQADVFTLNQATSQTDLAIMAGGRFSVDATDEAGNNIKVSTQGTDAGGCLYEGSINGIALPSFDDPNPCSSQRFWAWWASHALSKVEEVVGAQTRKAIESFLLRFIH